MRRSSRIQAKLMQTQRPSIETQQQSPHTETNAQHWFTQLLPEGLCVGVCTNHVVAPTTMPDNGEELILLNSTTLLHSEEYQWGKNNISSDASRTSYYLGRMALRLSLRGLLENENGVVTTTDTPFKTDAEKEINSTTRAIGSTIESGGNSFRTRLHDKIQTTAIMKDYHGRPILPEIILGSISHKGEYAVGLARFRSCDWDSPDEDLGRGLLQEEEDVTGSKEASLVEWREECPILAEGVSTDAVGYDDGSAPDSKLASAVRGIGIDLERIDGGRGKRIGRRVLTEKEQKELGRLEAIGISKEQEAMLRFSLKESVYKAMHPIICQYVGFQEAEITPFPDGTAQVTLNLTSRSHEHLGIVVQSASWKTMGDFFVTSASVGLKDRC